MRTWSATLITLWLISLPCLGQHASVSVNANAGLPHDSRPFGKYLVEICTISGDTRTLSCQEAPLPSHLPNPGQGWAPRSALIQRRDQTITLKLVCDPAVKTPCDLQDPKVGEAFFVTATADSGQPVRQRVILGSATPIGGYRTVEYRANAPGPIIIRATLDPVSGDSPYIAAAPVDLIVQVSSDSGSTSSSSCPVLPPQAGTQSKPLDATTIVTLLGNPTPFILAAQGPDTIFIYSTRQPLGHEELRILGSFQQAIAELAGRTAESLAITVAPAKPFSVELTVPHAGALGDLATRLGALNYSQFTLQDVGRNRVRVTAPTQPDCATWKGFLTDVREMAWQLVSDPMSYKLYYLSSSDVATAFSGLSSAAPASTAAPSPSAVTTTPNATTPAGASSTTSTTPSTTPSSTPSATSNSSTSTATPAGTSSTSSATIAITQPPGSNIQISSDTTPCVVAGLAFGNASACGSGQSTTATAGGNSTSPAASASTAVTAAPPGPLAMASVSVAAGITEQTPPDLLLYSDTNPGDDAQIEERNRIIAQLDLPRPEMILSAWVTQNSSSSPEAMGAFSNMVKDLVANYDHEFENVVLEGWNSVKLQSAEDGYFNEPFRSYIEDRFIADTFKKSAPGSSVQALSQAFLDTSQASLADPVYPMKRTDLGICERGHYCLGYNGLFSPIKPALTDLLLTIIAAQNPVNVANNAIAAVEGPEPLAPSEAICDNREPEVQKRCRAIWHNLDVDHVSPPPGPPSCAERDFRGILGSLLNIGEPRVHLQCFRQEADRLLSPAPEVGGSPPYGAGLLRAAIADFLFNYKMSQQYPHEFAPYDLNHSADALNNALSPLIDAFNRDLWSYQIFVRADMQYRVEQLNSRTDGRCCVKRLFGLDKPSFFNDGLVTVRTISGQSTSVGTTSQSFLNGSTAPELSALLSSLAGIASPGAGGSPAASPPSGTTTTTTTTTTSGAPPTPSPGGSGGSAPTTPFGAIAAGLANYQTSFAQIGRQLSFAVTPRSLSTASSAELAVTLNADESAGGPLYTGGGATDPALNTSRVANHDTTTRVRVDSIKLFEVSSFSAIVERSRSRFPLLPPFVEIPYIGTFAGIPLGSAKEFHSSTAIVSAYVVPTAADIAYGLRFVSDLVVDGLNPGPCGLYKGASAPVVSNTCVFRKALSLRDTGTLNFNELNKRMIQCFAMDTSQSGCEHVSFDNIIQQYR
jgi:hypothetical protein